MPHEFIETRHVEFAETDMAGIVHFANFFRYMEMAEHAFFRSLGLSIHMEVEGRRIGWPRVHAECDYRHPLRFEDRVEVHLIVREKRPRSLHYEFIFRKLGGEEGPLEVARGAVTTVCVAMDGPAGKMKAVEIPALISERIEAAPSEEFINAGSEA